MEILLRGKRCCIIINDDKTHIGDSMELRVLRYFLMVAREENITNAAEVLHMTFSR